LEEAVVKKPLAFVVLGIALLTASGIAHAAPRRSAEPRWEIRSERSSAPSSLDIARWLAKRLLETAFLTAPVPVVPPEAPQPPGDPEPSTVGADGVCVPERGHCPIG